MKNIGVFLLVLFSLGTLNMVPAAPPTGDDIGYQVYLLKKKVDEHGQRLEVVERRTKTFTGLKVTEKRPATAAASAHKAAATAAG